MKKYKKNLLTFALASILLSGCGKEDTTASDDKIVVENVDEYSNESVEKPKTGADIFADNTDISSYNLYDDTMVTGISVKDVESGEESKYLLTKTHRMIFDKEEYGTIEDFMNDAKKAVSGYLTDEEVEASNIVVVITTYLGIDEASHLSEKRTIFETPKGDDIELIVSIDRTFIDDEKEMGVAIRTISVDGLQVSYGVMLKDGEMIDIDDPIDAQNAISEFSIPTGVYTKEDLEKLLDNEKNKELSLN